MSVVLLLASTDKDNHIMDTTDQNAISKKDTSTKSQKTLNMQKYRAMASVEAIAESRNTDRESKKRKRKNMTEEQHRQEKMKMRETYHAKKKIELAEQEVQLKNYPTIESLHMAAKVISESMHNKDKLPQQPI